MGKINFIQDLINQCDDVVSNRFNKEAKILSNKITSTFEYEIRGIQNGLDEYEGVGISNIDFMGDIKKLRVKLQNYMYNLERTDQISERELEKLRLQSTVSNVFNNTNTNSNTVNISIVNTIKTNINNCIEIIGNADELNQKEKEEIEGSLIDFEREVVKENKKNSKDKLKSIVGYLADKGTDTFISLLPSIGTISSLLEKM